MVPHVLGKNKFWSDMFLPRQCNPLNQSCGARLFLIQGNYGFYGKMNTRFGGAVGKTSVTNEIAERIVNAFGVKVLVQLHAPIDAAPGYAVQMINRLANAWVDSPEPDGDPTEPLMIDLGEVCEERFEQIHSTMSTQVTLAALKSHAGRALMFHAGGIALEDGRVAAIVGPSGMGKTTTLRELGRYYGYVSDETIAITADGVVLPYRKPLSVIAEGHAHKLQIPPSRLNLMPLPEKPLRLGGIIILKRATEGITASTVTPMGFAAGIAMVVEQSSYLIDLEQPLTRVSEVAAKVGGFKLLTAGVPERIHEVAEDLFVQSIAPAWERVMPSERISSTTGAAYEPADIVDAVECDDGTIVFSRMRQAMVLHGIGPQLWRAACAGDSWESLVTRVKKLHGSAPGGDTRAAIELLGEELIEVGVLKRPAGEFGETVR